MTEKRFNIEYVQGNPTIFHIVDDGKHIDEMKIVDLLNGYYESNKNLYNNYMRLMEENEQLKSSIWKCRLCGNTGTIEHIAKRNGDVE